MSDTCHCPHCGRFVRHIWAESNAESLTGVFAKCIVHGKVEVKRFVDGEDVGWGWDDFESVEPVPAFRGSATLAASTHASSCPLRAPAKAAPSDAQPPRRS